MKLFSLRKNQIAISTKVTEVSWEVVYCLYFHQNRAKEESTDAVGYCPGKCQLLHSLVLSQGPHKAEVCQPVAGEVNFGDEVDVLRKVLQTDHYCLDFHTFWLKVVWLGVLVLNSTQCKRGITTVHTKKWSILMPDDFFLPAKFHLETGCPDNV